MRWTRLGRGAALALAGVLVLGACAAGSDSKADGGTSSTEAGATGPSPGVTADAIKIGVTYPDAKSLVASGLNYDLGDYEGVYNALFDAINADGGINGRKIEPVFAPIDPTKTAPAEEACVKLTEDDDVFAVVGFFLADAVVCPVSTHSTAVLGGGMTKERLKQAKAPWAVWEPDDDGPEQVIRTLDEQGELDGKVAVYSAARDKDQVDKVVLPTLKDLGVEPVEVGILDAPPDDQAAVQSGVERIGQRFEAAGADTVLLVGQSAQDYPTYMASNTSYRPKLLFLDVLGARAFATNKATTDTSILEGSLGAGGYGPDQARWDEPEMQKCLKTLTDAGLEIPSPEEAGTDPSNQPFQSAFYGCSDVALLSAWLDAAGKDLNYGTLEAALEGLKVKIPGDPTERTYGPAPAADGNPTSYLYTWDEASKTYVLPEG